MSGTRLGPYRLLHEVGGGGMGVVHLALDRDSRAVAIKVLRPHLAADADARARLAREGDTLRLVRSPRVAEVLDTAAQADPPYIVTQFVAAPPLDEHVAAHGPLGGRPLARLGLGLGEALAAIHRAGVVHRDLKPGNVLIDDDGPVVIDFGIAQIADDVRLTHAGLVMGTPGYLSPEVIDGAPVSFAGDWWGWAATMLFAATGRPPFGTGPVDAVLARVHRGAPDVSGVEEPFAALLRAAMSVDPGDRPTPRRLREALQAFVGGDADDRFADDDVDGFAATDDEPGQGPAASHPTVVLTSAGAGAGADPEPRPGPAAPPEPAPVPDGVTRPLPLAAPPEQHRPYRVPEEEYAPNQQYAPAPAYPPGAPPQPGGASGSEVDPAPTRPALVRGRPGIALLIGAVVAVSAGLTPVRVALGLVAASLVLRTLDRSADGLSRRRWERGARGSDGPLTVLAAPVHLLAAAFITVGALVLPVLMGLSAAFITGWALNPGGAPLPGAALALVVGCAVAVLTAWWGPGGASLRRGTRLAVRAVTPGQPAVVIGAGVLALVLLAVLLALGASAAPSWAPLPGPPLGLGEPLG